VPDPFRVTIKTATPMGTLLSNLTMLLIVPAGTAPTTAFGDRPIGTGPYKFVEFVRDTRVTLEANANYWQRGTPKAPRLVFVAKINVKGVVPGNGHRRTTNGNRRKKAMLAQICRVAKDSSTVRTFMVAEPSSGGRSAPDASRSTRALDGDAESPVSACRADRIASPSETILLLGPGSPRRIAPGCTRSDR